VEKCLKLINKPVIAITLYTHIKIYVLAINGLKLYLEFLGILFSGSYLERLYENKQKHHYCHSEFISESLVLSTYMSNRFRIKSGMTIHGQPVESRIRNHFLKYSPRPGLNIQQIT
jgi:hypothetical protein